MRKTINMLTKIGGYLMAIVNARGKNISYFTDFIELYQLSIGLQAIDAMSSTRNSVL